LLQETRSILGHETQNESISNTLEIAKIYKNISLLQNSITTTPNALTLKIFLAFLKQPEYVAHPY